MVLFEVLILSDSKNGCMFSDYFGMACKCNAMQAAKAINTCSKSFLGFCKLVFIENGKHLKPFVEIDAEESLCSYNRQPVNSSKKAEEE